MLTQSLIPLRKWSMETPLKFPNKLAGTPTHSLKYAQKVKLKSGEQIEVADPTATRALVSLMDMQAVLGGAASHFGGPSAFAELMSAMHGIVFHEARKKNLPWHQMFHLLNDAGHCENGIYALKANYGFADLTLEKLKGFRSITSPLTGHGEAHIYPESVYMSNGPLGSCFPQAQGLCMADKLMGNSRVTITAISDGGCMEGEAREAMAAIPGLAQRGKMNPFVMIISDNNTKLSGRIDQDCFSMMPSFQALATLGWNYIRLEQGHDLQKCVEVIEQAIEQARQNPQKPVAIHAKTIKGYGVAKTEQSASGGHGFPLSDPKDLKAFIDEIYKQREVPQEFYNWVNELVDEKNKKSAATAGAPAQLKTEKVQTGISQAMLKKRKAGLPIVSVTSDLPGSTGVAGFQKEFQSVTIDVGVAESNMVSVAAGLSKEGFIPVVDTFAQFGVTKGALPLTMAALSDAPVICVFSHVGFQDAADGASHQALCYYAMVSAIPHTKVFSLTSSSEAEALMSQAIDEFAADRKAGKTPHNYVFFLGRENFPPTYLTADYKYKLGEAQVVFDNTDKYSNGVTIVASGALLHQALEAAFKLDAEKRGACVVNPSIINHPDLNTLRSCLRNTGGQLLTVEDHQLIGGMGAMLTHALAQAGVPFQVKSLGVKGEFGQSAYNAIDLYKKHGLDASAILQTAKSF